MSVPPLPIPNREVKAHWPDDTPLGESRVCQHMKVPIFITETKKQKRHLL